MPLDFPAGPTAPKARMLAQVRAAVGAAPQGRRALPLVEAVVLYMADDAAPEDVADLIVSGNALLEALRQTGQPLADFEAAIRKASAEPGDGATARDRFLAALRDIACDRAASESEVARLGRGFPPGPSSRSAPLQAQLADALYARITGKDSGIGARYAGASLPEMAEICVRASGRSAGSGAWLGGRGGQAVMEALHTTSDFPLLLGNVTNRVMLDYYQAAQSGMTMVSRERLVSDFRAVHGLRASGALEFKRVNEAGEFTYGTIEEAVETVTAATYGRVFGVTRQAIVNDDVELFGNVSRMLGEGSAQAEGKAFAGLMAANSGAGLTMSDGKALFHADHGNLAAAPAAISVASLSVARAAIRRQTDDAGGTINATPVYVVVPPEKETEAQRVLTEISATEVGEVNPFGGNLQLVVDAYLTNPSRWYLASAPGRPKGLTHVYLDGARGPQLFTQEGFDIDGVKFKGRLDFGCAFMDWRGWFMNPGA